MFDKKQYEKSKVAAANVKFFSSQRYVESLRAFRGIVLATFITKGKRKNSWLRHQLGLTSKLLRIKIYCLSFFHFSGSTTELKDEECKFKKLHLDPNLLAAKTVDDDMWLVNEWVVGPQPQTDVLNNHYFRLLLAILFSFFASK